MKFGNRFLNKFAAKIFYVFQLTWIMALHYLGKLGSLCYVLPSSCYRKKLKNLSHLNCVLQIRQIWIQLIIVCAKYCRDCVQNMHHCSGAILTTRLTNGCRNDDTIQLGPLRSQSLFQFVHIMMRICTPFLAILPHAVINCI